MVELWWTLREYVFRVAWRICVAADVQLPRRVRVLSVCVALTTHEFPAHKCWTTEVSCWGKEKCDWVHTHTHTHTHSHTDTAPSLFRVTTLVWSVCRHSAKKDPVRFDGTIKLLTDNRKALCSTSYSDDLWLVRQYKTCSVLWLIVIQHSPLPSHQLTRTIWVFLDELISA